MYEVSNHEVKSRLLKPKPRMILGQKCLCLLNQVMCLTGISERTIEFHHFQERLTHLGISAERQTAKTL
jgi:hypothetical protein